MKILGLGIGVDDVAIDLDFIEAGIGRLGDGIDLGILAQARLDELLDGGLGAVGGLGLRMGAHAHDGGSQQHGCHAQMAQGARTCGQKIFHTRPDSNQTRAQSSERRPQSRAGTGFAHVFQQCRGKVSCWRRRP
jgi:hypothetical protein